MITTRRGKAGSSTPFALHGLPVRFVAWILQLTLLFSLVFLVVFLSFSIPPFPSEPTQTDAIPLALHNDTAVKPRTYNSFILIWENMKHHQHSAFIVFSPTCSLHSMGRMKMSCSRPLWSTMCPTLSHCPKRLSPSAKGWVAVFL